MAGVERRSNRLLLSPAASAGDFEFVNITGFGYQGWMNDAGFRGRRDRGGAEETIRAAANRLVNRASRAA